VWSRAIQGAAALFLGGQDADRRPEDFAALLTLIFAKAVTYKLAASREAGGPIVWGLGRREGSRRRFIHIGDRMRWRCCARSISRGVGEYPGKEIGCESAIDEGRGERIRRPSATVHAGVSCAPPVAWFFGLFKTR